MMTQLAKERIEQKKLHDRQKKEKRKTTSELAREAYTSYIDDIERAKSLENMIMKCTEILLDMWNKIILLKIFFYFKIYIKLSYIPSDNSAM
jgi:aspartate/glutamate racemase